jgi:hypothetical protein
MSDYPAGMWVDQICFMIGHMVLLVTSILQVCVAPKRTGTGQRGPNNTRHVFQRACLLLSILFIYRPFDFWRLREVHIRLLLAVFTL